MKKAKSMLALLLCGAMLANPAFAFSVDLPEAGVNGDVTAAAALSGDGLVKFDKTKGELLYADNFSDAAYNKSGFAFGVVHEDTRVPYGTVVTPDDTHTFLASAAVQSNGNPFFIGDADGKKIESAGKVTVDLNVYVDATAAKGSFSRVNKSDDYANWSFNKASGFGEWKSYTESWNVDKFDCFDIGMYTAKDIASFYFDDVAIWFKPDDALILMSADGTAGETVTLTDTYTLAAPEALGYGSAGQVWTTDGMAAFEAKDYTADELKGKVLYPMDGAVAAEHAAVPAKFVNGKGQLMYFTDFSGEDVFTNTLDLAVVSGNDGSGNGVFDGYYARRCGNSKLDPVTEGIEVTYNGDTWRYVTGEPFTGKLTMYIDMYIDNDASQGRFTVAAPGSDWGAYWTSWSVSGSAAARAWAKVYSTAVNPAAYTRFGILSSGWKEEYCRALGVYAIPSNAYWLGKSKDDAEPAMFYYDGDTVTLPSTFDGAAVDTWTDGSKRFAPGSVNAADISGKLLFPISTVEIPALYVEGKGQLLYFTDFSGEDVFTNTLDLKVVDNSGSGNLLFDGYSARRCGNSKLQPVTEGIEVTYNGDTWSYVTGKPFTGKLMMYIDMYINNDASQGRFTVAAPGTDWGDYWTSWSVSGSAAARAWSKVYSTAVNPAAYTRFGILSSGWKEEYCRALGVYAIPNDGYWLSSGEKDYEPTIYFFDGDTVTLPATYGGKTVLEWTDGVSSWTPGSVASSAVAAKRLYPYSEPEKATAPAAYIEGKGQLMYFTNFSDDTFDNILDLQIVANNGCGNAMMDGFYAYRCGNSKLDPTTEGIEVTYNGDTWSYADGMPFKGTMTMYAELYVNNDANSGRFTVAAPGADWGAYWTSWSCTGNPGARAWSQTYSTAVNPASYTRFGLLSNGWKEEYCRALGIYAIPTNGYWLSGAEKDYEPTLCRIDGDTVTLPSAYNGVEVTQWTDGASKFAPGAVASSAVAAKRLYPYKEAAYASVPETTVEGLGKLVWFENFNEAGSGFTNKLNMEVINKGDNAARDGFHCISTKNDTNSPETVGVLVKPESGSWTYTDGKPVTGKITLVAEVYTENTGITAVYSVAHRPGATEWGIYDTDWVNRKPTAKEWSRVQTTTYELGSYEHLGMLTNNWSGFYVRSLALYVDAPEPEVEVPVLPEKNTSIRFADPTGIRFAAFVSADLRADADEYGFIVAVDDAVNDNYDKLVFDDSHSASGVNGEGVKYVSGAAYNKTTGIDLVYATDGAAFGGDSFGEGVFYTGVVYNIPSSSYAAKLAARPYIVIGGTTLYGEASAASIYDVAKAYEKICGETGETVNETAAAIIQTVEQAN